MRSSFLKKPLRFKKIPAIALSAFLFLLLLLFSCFPKRYMQICLDGLSLWAICVLPSSLPFLFVTALLTKTGSVSALSRKLDPVTAFLFGVSGLGGYCFLISALCGYPVGASTLSDLKKGGALSAAEATKISALCSSSGPLFILGSVGVGMFGAPRVGYIILAAHILSVLFCGILFRGYKKKEIAVTPQTADAERRDKPDNILYDCMLSSILSALCVGGFVAIFYTFSFILSDWNLLRPLENAIALFGADERIAEGVARGLVEMTGGCKTLAFSAAHANVAACAFLITLGGISVIFQQICFLKKADVNVRFFLCVKLLQACLAAILAFLLSIATQ